MLELSFNALGPIGMEVSLLNLLEEAEAPRLVAPRPLDDRARLCACPRVPRVLLPRSSIGFVVDHEEEVSGREEEQLFCFGVSSPRHQ